MPTPLVPDLARLDVAKPTWSAAPLAANQRPETLKEHGYNKA